jgi:hypothetical protein
MISATLQQIKTAYEVNGMTIAEIVSDFDGLDEVAIKAGLMSCSSKYRKDCGVDKPDEDSLNFTDEQLEKVNRVIFETALSAEHSDGSVDYKTRLAAAVYLRDDKKGRKEAVKHLGNNTFNLFQFNQQLNQSRMLADNMRKMVE